MIACKGHIVYAHSKVYDLLFIDFLIYIVARINLVMVRNKVPQEYRKWLLESVWSGIQNSYEEIEDECSVIDVINNRMREYLKVLKANIGSTEKMFEKFHFMLTQLIYHAEQKKMLLLWKGASDNEPSPLIIADVAEEMKMRTFLSEIEKTIIIPFEAKSGKTFAKVSARWEKP